MYISNEFSHTLYTKRSLVLNSTIYSMQIFLLQRFSQVRKCSDFLTLRNFKEKMRVLLRKLCWMGQKQWQHKWNWNRVWFIWRSSKQASNCNKWDFLISEIPNIIYKENDILAPGQGKTSVSILTDEFCEEQVEQVSFSSEYIWL